MRLLGDEAFAAPTGTQFDAFPGPIPTRIGFRRDTPACSAGDRPAPHRCTATCA